MKYDFDPGVIPVRATAEQQTPWSGYYKTGLSGVHYMWGIDVAKAVKDITISKLKEL